METDEGELSLKAGYQQRKLNVDYGNAVATDSFGDRVGDGRKWTNLGLKPRNPLRGKPNEEAAMGEFLYRKRQRHRYPAEKYQPKVVKMLNLPKRRSRRLLDLEKFGNILRAGPSRHVSIGKQAQVDHVPNWKARDGSDENLDELKWLGTKVWPIRDGKPEINMESIGKGRPDFCGCLFPGSVECIRLHINTARKNLRSHLGSAFNDWCFEEMGEDVSNSWTPEDQLKFDVILKPISEVDDIKFFNAAFKHFTSKRTKDIVSYYFNVYCLRMMRKQNQFRSVAAAIDADKDGSSIANPIEIQWY